MSMTLVAVSVGIGLYLQFAMALWTAAGAALAIYVALVSAHALIRRSATIVALAGEIERLEDELADTRRIAGPRRAAPPLEPPLPPGPPRGRAGSSDPAPAPGGRPLPPRFAPPGAARPAAAPEARAHPFASPLPGAAGHPAPARAPAAPGVAPAPAAGTAAAPLERGAPGAHPGGAAAVSAPGEMRPPAPAAAVRSRETAPAEALQAEAAGVAADVDAINGIIRRIAEEMSTLADEGEAPAASAAADAAATGIAASVDGLRTAATTLRRGASHATAPSPEPARPLEPAQPAAASPGPDGAPGVEADAAQVRGAELAEAVAAQRLELFLEPISNLADRRARHYDFSVRIKTAQGRSVAPADYLPAVRGTGLLPPLEALAMSRLAKVAAYTVGHGSLGLLFADLGIESLASEEFMGRIAEVLPAGSPLPGRIVLSFAQSDLRRLGSRQAAALEKLGKAGFRLAVHAIADADMKFAELRSAGFGFVRPGTAALVAGLRAQQGPLPAREFCRLAGEAELAIIAGGIDSEAELYAAIGLGLSLGQGALFGVPRPVRLEAARAAGVAA